MQGEPVPPPPVINNITIHAHDNATVSVTVVNNGAPAVAKPLKSCIRKSTKRRTTTASCVRPSRPQSARRVSEPRPMSGRVLRMEDEDEDDRQPERPPVHLTEETLFSQEQELTKEETLKLLTQAEVNAAHAARIKRDEKELLKFVMSKEQIDAIMLRCAQMYITRKKDQDPRPYKVSGEAVNRVYMRMLEDGIYTSIFANFRYKGPPLQPKPVHSKPVQTAPRRTNNRHRRRVSFAAGS